MPFRYCSAKQNMKQKMAVSRKAVKKNLKIQRMVKDSYNVRTAKWQFKAIINRVCE